MNIRIKTNIEIGFLLGAVEYIFLTFILELPYLLHKHNISIYFSLIAISVFAVIFAMLYKVSSTKGLILRSVIAVVSYILIFIIIGCIGLIPKLENLLGLQLDSAQESASGLMILFFSGVFILSCLLVVIVKLVKSLIQKVR